MNLKYFLDAVCCSFPLVLASCLGDSDEVEYIYSTDAQIFTFTLSHDSITELASVSFTIDQLNSKIYNKDSLAFGLESKITQYYPKAIFTYTTVITDGGNIVLKDGNEDSESPTIINTGDSIDITQFLNNPKLYLRVYAVDGTKKEYTLDLRVHTIDPDSMIYEPISGQFSGEKVILWQDAFYTYSGQYNIVNYNDTLYTQTSSGTLSYSSDTLNWQQIPLGGAVASGTVAAVLGVIEPVPGRLNSLRLLSLIVDLNGTRFFVKTDLHQIWVKGDEVPDDFPLQDFSSVSWRKSGAYTSNLTLITGNAIWWTQGESTGWTKISSSHFVQGGAFAVSDFSNIFYYDDKLHLMNGTGYNNKIYTSIDGGLTWSEMPDKYLPPVEYDYREGASVCVTKDNYIYIFGGKSQAGPLFDVWRARLNKLSFEN
ncbi:MAG: DUF6242 domain-containing protein [Dysgonamonadaceae bacterium]|jgi:hypothetical protein|nr:DUF6242 domain-containing protein [Dysgonamonadaceae bacterium]